MHPFPHNYQVKAAASGEGAVTLSAQDLPNMLSAPPAEFDGPGDQWSPETLLLAAVSDCFVLSFRAVAAASRFAWLSLDCQTHGVLDNVDHVTRFTQITNTATLKIPASSTEARAQSLLEKAEKVCLISNSLACNVHLVVNISHED